MAEEKSVNRRDMLRQAMASGAAIVGTMIGQKAHALANLPVEEPKPEPRPPEADLAKRLPRWRGFNLLEKFQAPSAKPFAETDFRWIADWGFDFVRLPMDYRCWTDPKDPQKVDERVLAEIDQAVDLGRKYKVHVCLCLHRAPGYTVASPPEKLNLWTDEEAQKQFDFQWSLLAKRYKDRPATEVSCNLVNEPDDKVKPEAYAKVVRRAAAAIHREDPRRLVLADGLSWGRVPVMELADAGVAQSTRGYDPFPLTHYKASWAGGERFPLPTWPLKENGQTEDREWLRRQQIDPWKKLEAKGVGVHVGEWGAYCYTPHDVVLGWMRDNLALWKEAGWGWSLWNFRGTFGVLDSERKDVAYEDFHGHKLDKKMLDLLRQS
jgi:endoglucanase